MKPKFVLFTICCLLCAVGAGQWFETLIDLRDSLGGLANPRCFAYDSINNTVYVGAESGGCIVAIDGATNEKIARIPAGPKVFALCCNSRENKVYAADYLADSVTIIDAAGNRVIAARSESRASGVRTGKTARSCGRGAHED